MAHDPKPPRRIKRVRRCEVCGNRLSAYNPAKRCYSHDNPRDDRRVSGHAKKH